MSTTYTAPDLSTCQFVCQYLVTDTIIYEVVKRTACTLTLRTTKETGNSYHDRTGDYCDELPIVMREVTSDPTGTTYVVRRNKRGYYCLLGGRSLVPVVGTPYTRTDYRW